MKNIFNKFAFFIALSFVFISCGNLTTSENDDSIPQGKGKITISTDLDSQSRSVLPTAIDETTTGLKWELEGTCEGKTYSNIWNDTISEDGVVTTAYNKMKSANDLLLDVGTWNFTLKVKNNSGYVLFATKEVSIETGENKLSFEMKEATSSDIANGETVATGSIEFTLNFPKDVVTKGIATLTTYEGTNPDPQEFTADAATSNQFLSSITYTNENISAGYYILKIQLQQEKGDATTPAVEYINTYSCLIRVAPGLLSQGEDTLDELAQLYTITYNLNEGTFDSTAVPTSYNAYTSFALPTPTKAGYEFAGWYTQDYTDTGSITENLFGKAGETTTISEDITLYAKWTPNTYTVTFDANGGSGEMDSQSFTYDAAQNLTENKFTRSGYTFAGWNTSSEGTGTSYDNSASIKNLTDEPNGNITLYAQWEKVVIALAQGVLNGYINNDRYTLPSGEYCVIGNLSLEYPIVIDGNVSIYPYSDRDYTISVSENYNSNNSSSWLSMIVISTANDTLTLGGGTGNLTIDGTNNLSSTLNYLVMSSGTFNLSDKVTITNGNVNYGAVYIGGGTFTMTGGSIEYNNSKTEGYGAGIHVQGDPNTTTVNISGGSVYNNYYSTNTNQFASICNKGGNVIILGETLDNEKFTQNIINGNITDEIPVSSWEELVTNINSIPSSKTDTTKFLVTNDLVVTETCYNYSPITITPVGNVKITTTNCTIFTPNANLTITGDADNTLTLQGNTSTNIGLIDSDFSNEININLQFCNISDGYILVENFENWTMTNCTIKNSSYDYGAFSLNTSGNVTINDCSFESNTYDVYVKNSPILTLNGTLKLPKIYYDNLLTGRDLGIVIGENLQLKDETKISIEIYSTEENKYDIDLFNLADGQNVPEEIFTLVNESYQINSSTGEIEKIGGGNELLVGTEVDSFDALKDAINADAEVIIITRDITITECLDIKRAITIAANYEVIVIDDSKDSGSSYYAFCVNDGGKLTLGGGSGVLTFKQATDKTYATIGTVSSNATVEININNNVKFTENPYYCISFVAGTGAVLNINGGEFVNNSYTPIQISNQNAVCYITGGTIANNSSSANNCAGIYVKYGNLTITGGDITNNTYTSNSSYSGSSIRAPASGKGTVTINGTAITASTTYTTNIINGKPQE